MRKDCIYDFLKSVPAFSNVGDAALDRIKEHLFKMQYSEGEIVYQQGDTVTTLFLVEMGKIEIYKTDREGKKLTLWFINPGELFCVPTLLFETAIANALAVKDSLVYCLDKKNFDSLIREFPEISTGLLLCLAGRIMSYSDSVETVAFDSTLSRVANILLKHQTSDTGGQAVCQLSQNEITSLAGTCRETVCRALNKLKTENIISVKRRKIIIHDDQKLKSKCAKFS